MLNCVCTLFLTKTCDPNDHASNGEILHFLHPQTSTPSGTFSIPSILPPPSCLAIQPFS